MIRRSLRPIIFGSSDADAKDWALRVSTAGGSVSPPTLKAVSNFVKGAKGAGIWSKINRLNLMCGDQLTAALIPLKVGNGSATDTNTNFVVGDYTETTGLTGNGTTKFLNTGLVPSTGLTLNDTHLAIYNRSSSAATACVIGAADGVNFFQLVAPLTDSKVYSDQYNSAGGRLVSGAAISAPFGFVVGSRTASNNHTIYQNGGSIGTNAVGAGALPAFSVDVLARNDSGAAASFGVGPIAGYSIGSGLASADVSAYYQLIQAFQAALGRSV